MPDIKFRLKRQDPQDKKNPEAHWEEYTVHYEGVNLTVLGSRWRCRSAPVVPRAADRGDASTAGFGAR